MAVARTDQQTALIYDATAVAITRCGCNSTVFLIRLIPAVRGKANQTTSISLTNNHPLWVILSCAQQPGRGGHSATPASLSSASRTVLVRPKRPQTSVNDVRHTSSPSHPLRRRDAWYEPPKPEHLSRSPCRTCQRERALMRSVKHRSTAALRFSLDIAHRLFHCLGWHY
jgi:hypothetical protein